MSFVANIHCALSASAVNKKRCLRRCFHHKKHPVLTKQKSVADQVTCISCLLNTAPGYTHIHPVGSVGIYVNYILSRVAVDITGKDLELRPLMAYRMILVYV